jgi:hypothetical protein
MRAFVAEVRWIAARCSELGLHNEARECLHLVHGW